jgi:predicted dehydrogenase
MSMTGQSKSVLIVGVGSIGERHLRCFQATGRADVAICEVNEVLRAAIAERYRVRRAYGTFEEAVAEGFDAAVIATPAPFHLPQAQAAAERGIHLLIEKPLSTTLDGVNALQRTCDSQGLTAAVAYVLRQHPALRAAREAVASGRFGRPLQVVVVSGQNFPFYRPAYRETYYARRSAGGGAVQDALTHFVNVVEWMAGPMDRVLADAAHLAVPGVEVEDTVHVVARHGDVLAAYTLNQHQAPNESTITVVCERGVVRTELHNNRWAFIERPDGAWTEQRFDDLQRDDLFIAQATNFLNAIDGVGTAGCSLAEGATTLASNLAILEAIDRSPWLKVSPTT